VGRQVVWGNKGESWHKTAIQGRRKRRVSRQKKFWLAGVKSSTLLKEERAVSRPRKWRGYDFWQCGEKGRRGVDKARKNFKVLEARAITGKRPAAGEIAKVRKNG